MAVHGQAPFIEVHDSNGNPIVGAKLYIYEAGTTTERAIYSDDGLSTPMSNPLEGDDASDAAGRFPRFYMAAGTYKLRAVTSADVLIWEYDDIDTGLSAGAGALPISAGGTGATSAAAARTALDVPSNSELADLAADITSLTSAIQAVIGTPQGRLTLTSATPVLTTGVSAGTAVYYTPYIGAQIPIYGGTQFSIHTFTELTLTLNASHVANAIYDVFVWNDGGTLRLVTGPAWNTPTAGSGARGSGAGTTELERLNGIWVNAVAMTARNGGTTYSVDENEATYVGSISMDGSNGQISCLNDFGQNRKWGVWNAYNRVAIIMRSGDSTASWNYSTATVRQSNAATGNRATVFCGLAEEQIEITFRQNMTLSNNSSGATVGIGINSTTSVAGSPGTINAGSTTSLGGYIEAGYVSPPFIGINNFNMLETGNGTATAQFNGAGNSVMTTKYFG